MMHENIAKGTMDSMVECFVLNQQLQHTIRPEVMFRPVLDKKKSHIIKWLLLAGLPSFDLADAFKIC